MTENNLIKLKNNIGGYIQNYGFISVSKNIDFAKSFITKAKTVLLTIYVDGNIEKDS